MTKGETYDVKYTRSGEDRQFTGRVASDPSDRVVYFATSNGETVGLDKTEITGLSLVIDLSARG